MLDATIFNCDKADYGLNDSLFLGEPPGLFDTVHRRFPEIWEFYKNMKSLDWDELEFDFRGCNVEFKTRPKAISDAMIKTLAWQWEADSVAAHTLLPIMAPFISAPELQAAWTRVTDNEILHAATYSEIVRNSFDDPDTVLKEVLKAKEAMARMKVISDIMANSYRISHEYALGMHKRDSDVVYDAALMYSVASLCMERIQFMASFAVTFAIGEVGAFMPIAKAVQKICQDEFEVHQALHKAVLKHEFRLPKGKAFLARNRDKIKTAIEEVVTTEVTWVDNYLFGDGDPLVGLTAKLLKEWIHYSAADVCHFFQIRTWFPVPKQIPIQYMANWMNIAKTQPSPQEQQIGAYKVNVMTRDDEGKVFEVDF